MNHCKKKLLRRQAKNNRSLTYKTKTFYSITIENSKILKVEKSSIFRH